MEFDVNVVDGLVSDLNDLSLLASGFGIVA